MNWSQLLSSQRPGSKPARAEWSRSAFEQDYDRIIFSDPFRRLQDKTQVHPLPEHAFVHTRLTHSLEVSTVGRSLGKKAGEVILSRHKDIAESFSLFDFGAVVAAASLAHDVGNPPFGHAGENAISDFFRFDSAGKRFEEAVTPVQWEELTRFEGNAQGFRVLNGNQHGLRLTLATLGAFTKYPCLAKLAVRDKSRRSQKKYGYFDSEASLFAEVASSLGLIGLGEGVWCRHPLAFLVEAADDICYSIIDLEDGCRLGLLSFDETVELLAPILGDKLDRDKLARGASSNENLGILRAMAIGELIDSAAEVFLAHEEELLTGSFDQALVELCDHSKAVKDINEISVRKIYRARTVMEIEAAGHKVLPGLLHEFVDAAYHVALGSQSRKYQNLAMLLPAETQRLLREQPENRYQWLRACIDFISGMTDRHAISLYRKINGISLN